MKPSFRLADWLVEPGRNQLARGNEKKRLEPRVMELLCFLAERPGRVVSRDEILEAVWRGTFVSDEVLTNAVRQLRKALGDNAQEPRYVRTVPKRGYELVAGVESGAEGIDRRRFWGTGIVAVVTVVTATIFLFGGSDDEPRPVSIGDRPRLLVLPVENASGDDSLDWLSTAITDMLVTNLSRSRRFLDYWKDGDLDKDRMAEARAKLAR